MSKDQGGRKRSHWAWGWDDKFPGKIKRVALGAQVRLATGLSAKTPEDPVPLDAVELAPSRLQVPAALDPWVSQDREQRIRHTYGKSYHDQIRGFRGDFSAAPDLVARPRTEDEIERVLEWASTARVAVVPFGGGTSVVGGVEGNVGQGFEGVLSLDMRALNRVLEIDPVSRSARIQAGALGPDLERQLAAEGHTLRHFPQSFEFSTLGGWIATRAGGHFATVYTHIDDLVQSTRMIAPTGLWQSRRLPGSGAGPSPDRLVLGSEGTLGVITEAWMRIRPRPTRRSKADIHFKEWSAAVDAVRELSQSRLFPSNCRLLDRREALLNRVGREHVLLLAFEADHGSTVPWMDAALEIVSRHGGQCPDGPRHREDGPEAAGAAQRWRQAFFDGPYLQGSLASLGLIADTFETACTWDCFDTLHRSVIQRMRDAMEDVCGSRGFISCRFTHVYPDGPAPYFTFIAPARRGDEVAQWQALKTVASDTLLELGGTITHHHAVGRTHRPWYERQVPAPFQAGLRATKNALDPAGILNPGVLLPRD